MCSGFSLLATWPTRKYSAISGLAMSASFLAACSQRLGVRSLRELAKCELHIHLEGAMRTETLIELCTAHGVEVPPDPRGKKYSNFDAFAACYRAACECLRERDDVFRIVRELLEDAVAAGCRWLEVAPSFQLWGELKTHKPLDSRPTAQDSHGLTILTLTNGSPTWQPIVSADSSPRRFCSSRRPQRPRTR